MALPTTTWPLTAGQNIQVGNVTVSNDAQNIYVTYTLTSANATFGTLHLWIGDDLANVPKNSQGIVVPGQFPYQHDASGLRTYTFTVPLSAVGIPDVHAVCGETMYVVSHAEVTMGDGSHETAFGGNEAGNGPRWWFYGHFPLYCPPVDPPSPPTRTETAWGGDTSGGGPAWWFYFDTQGPAIQAIYAGQHRTDGSVTWDGTNLTINLGSWSLQKVSEPVKVQGYNDVPLSRPAAGQFTTYKGSSLVVRGDGSRYYAIHLDVQI